MNWIIFKRKFRLISQRKKCKNWKNYLKERKMHGIFMRKIPHNHGILSIMKAGEKKTSWRSEWQLWNHQKQCKILLAVPCYSYLLRLMLFVYFLCILPPRTFSKGIDKIFFIFVARLKSLLEMVLFHCHR